MCEKDNLNKIIVETMVKKLDSEKKYAQIEIENDELK